MKTRSFPILIFFFSLSVIANIFLIAPYISTVFQKIDVRNKCIDFETDDSSVIKLVADGSMKMNSQMITDEFSGFPGDQIKFWTRRKRHGKITNYYNTAYLYAGLSYYALNTDSTEEQNKVSRYLFSQSASWDKGLELNYELAFVDQVPIGIAYINLYKITGDERYLSVVNQIFNFVLCLRESGSNLIRYRKESNRNCVDCLGMIVPFLMEYYWLTKDIRAYDIVRDNVVDFQTKGLDCTTQLPYHAYDIDSRIHLGSINWGRGIGWYLLALSYCPEFSNDVLFANVCKLPYTQFPLSSSDFDSSTALMFEIYKREVSGSWTGSLDFIKSHIGNDGMIMGCSGDTYVLNRYSHSFGPSELCNGLFFIMLYRKNPYQQCE